jgi:TolB protein
LVDAETNAVQTIYTTDKVDFTWGISWSPDGQYLVFSLGQGSHGNLYIVNIKTQQTKKITENDRSDFPVWSPKGNIIAFEVYEEKEYFTVLHLVDPEGKCDVTIPNTKYASSPTWSPDGKKLGYIDKDSISFLDVDLVLGRNVYQNLCQ